MGLVQIPVAGRQDEAVVAVGGGALGDAVADLFGSG